ncbi:hypothetical protein [Metasolibacillus sp.]|uniref:hypothetical protein n=1 Tax=Metasolibacillus sp. TaxID=2703680 RepID=UPI0025D8AB39|nr:hypothetical protein [Metasolibacillus sp.]MCT6922798.1 hypothetical protein [Metasolibacillus sp.]MCT6938863.1 hypothetical protein [Metasolibacillus sp.]
MKVLDGIQFFDAEQQYLKLYEYELEHEAHKKLTAASVVTYLLLRSVCDSAGQIYEADFNLKELSNKYSLPYSSIHNGYHRLFDIGLLTIKRIAGHTYITMPMVAAHLPDKEDSEISSYFRIPRMLFKGGFLKQFIKSRDVRGLLGVLDLLNGLFREWGRKRSTTLKRKKETLMKKIKQSKYAFKNWLQRVLSNEVDSPIVVKGETGELFELALAEAAFVEREKDDEFEQFNAATRNTLLSFIKSSHIKYRQEDIEDFQWVCQQELTEPIYKGIAEFISYEQDYANKVADGIIYVDGPGPSTEQLRLKSLLRSRKLLVPEILSATIVAVEQKSKSLKIKSLGAYFRKTLRIQIRAALKEDIGLRLAIAESYREKNLPVPVQFS